MESYIPISFLNDFIFCPLSIYYHQLYGNLSTRLYQDLPQIEGKAAHDSIDAKRYSTRKNVLQGIEIYSSNYNLCGKIDIFDIDSGILSERKKRIVKIYDGYIFQIYAHYYGLTEMGYAVKCLRFYSKDDNKVYPVPLPEEDPDMKSAFEKVVSDIKSFDIESFIPVSEAKCQKCIYEPLCDRSPL